MAQAPEEANPDPDDTNKLPELPKDASKMTDDDWAKFLGGKDSQAYQVLREKATDPSLHDKSKDKIKAGNLTYHKPERGYYACRGCGNPLYSWQSKFDSGCGWPAFSKCYKDSIIIEKDESYGMVRIEIMCSKCGGHLGHVFDDHGPERHCVNSSSVRYIKNNDEKVKDLKQETVMDKK